MRNRVCNAALIVAMLLLWRAPASAQMPVGDNTNLNLGGTIGMGYSGSFGSGNGSNHGLDFSGNGILHGYYYNPQFLNFDFQPYYRRSQNNSIFQTITNGKGFNASTNFFSGSHFPGSVSFSRTWDTTGQFGIPGLNEGITTHGSGHNEGITWSALIPDLPTLTASFSNSGGSSSIFGSTGKSQSASKLFSLQSTYNLRGFHLMGQYTHLAMDASFPELAGLTEAQDSNTGSNSFSFNVGHELPLHGYWNADWNRSSFRGGYRSDGSGGTNEGTVNSYDSMVSLNPTQKLGVGVGVTYNDNAYGYLQQQFLEQGGTLLPAVQNKSRTAAINAQAGYQVWRYMTVYGRVSHYEVWGPGMDGRGLTQVTGNAAFNFQQRLLGALTFSVGVVDTATEDGNSGASLVGNVNFMRRIDGWDVSGNYGYTQQVQTLFDVYTTSMMNYGAAARRKLGRVYWSNAFNGSKSGIQHVEGLSSRSEGFSTSFRYSRYTVNGQYSQSNGASLLTPGGLVPLPPGVPPLVPEPVFYNGKSYGGGGSVTPVRRCTISFNYSKATSGTVSTSLNNAFHSTMLNSRLDYRLRKLNVEANYTRFEQSITTATLPAVINTYYIRFSRWFNVF